MTTPTPFQDALPTLELAKLLLDMDGIDEDLDTEEKAAARKIVAIALDLAATFDEADLF